jgi:hypothetical protein
VSTVLAIDPGPVESAYVLIDTRGTPLSFAKVPNEALRDVLRFDRLGRMAHHVAIEMVASYGMPVGAEVFETCVWIGRFAETSVVDAQLVYRRDVKLHHCQSARAKDANITQALVDRFAPGQPNHGKGTKAAPGWFYGFKADIWQAYALAVYVADLLDPVPAAHPVTAGTDPQAVLL